MFLPRHEQIRDYRRLPEAYRRDKKRKQPDDVAKLAAPCVGDANAGTNVGENNGGQRETCTVKDELNKNGKGMEVENNGIPDKGEHDEKGQSKEAESTRSGIPDKGVLDEKGQGKEAENSGVPDKGMLDEKGQGKEAGNSGIPDSDVDGVMGLRPKVQMVVLKPTTESIIKDVAGMVDSTWSYGSILVCTAWPLLPCTAQIFVVYLHCAAQYR